MAQLIDGKRIAEEIRRQISENVARMKLDSGIIPGLAVVLVGENPASMAYVRMKGKGCEEVGIRSFQHRLESSVTESRLLSLINDLNMDKEVHGILVQLPLPAHINEKSVINAIDPKKDVDGFHPVNVGKMVVGDEDGLLPCTPVGCQELIVRHTDSTKGKHLVIVGRSNIVGKPLANIMVQKNRRADCVVTVVHTAAPDLGYYTRQADILVAAAGRPNTVTASMVKPGAVVIDVGSNKVTSSDNPEKTVFVGDVDFNGVREVASAITPVPGGVGPMTIAMLLKNTLKACSMQTGPG